MNDSSPESKRLTALLVFIAGGVLLTFVFWSGLWSGGGLIGGDVYTYYFPQKTFFASSWQSGEFPLWNNLVGHGYPLVAESQTGALYPPNWIWYSVFDVNGAYNANQLFHYIIAFVFTCLYARQVGLSKTAACLAALVYVYGWFPSRICLEWAIIGGAWLPVVLWCVEMFLETRHWRYWFALAVALAMQIVSGHFNIAFITELTLLLYIPARLWWMPPVAVSDKPAETKLLSIVFIGAIATSLVLSAAQMLPTWELKTTSQRSAVGEKHQPGYGHIPVKYLGQIVAPWMWYGTDVNSLLKPGDPATNIAEAHVYFGLIPLVLIVFGLFSGRVFKNKLLLFWLICGIAFLSYTPGWFLPITQHLPGFSFFMGPGRYSIITTFAAGLLAAFSFDCLRERIEINSPSLWKPLAVVVFVATTYDLFLVSRMVTYAFVVSNPVVNQVEASQVRKILQASDQPARLFCRGANLPTNIGVASTPVYLGIGPAAYFDEQTKMPGLPPFDENPTPAQIAWLQQAGITHVLSFSPLSTDVWPVRGVWQGHDAFLNRAWARQEPLFLYELQGSRGRIGWQLDAAENSAEIVEYKANTVSIKTNSTEKNRLVLYDLNYPGWEVTVDLKPSKPLTIENMYRGVEVPAGQHTVVWTYRPKSFYIGVVISGFTLFVLAAVGHIRFWHPQWLCRKGKAV